MGQDGNTIEIEIDAAATVAAAKTAGEANAKLAKFNSALGLFRDNVDLVTKTTDIVASKIGDFDSLLQKFADNLTSNLADMQTSVVKKVEPHLERELENMVNRVLNKVEGKVAPEKESRSRSEAKQGAAAPAQPVTVAQPPEYKRPDTKVKATFTDTTNQIVDTATGQVKENTSNRARTTATKTRHWQEEIDGEIQDFTETITSVSNSVRKATTAEKDRGLAIRKEITGALIGLHVMKVVSQYSSVFNAGFMQVAAAMGHLLNVVLLPMMPMFTQVAQVIHTLANFVSMLPLPMRQLIGALIMWKATSMLIASMPIKDVRDGFKGIVDVMRGAGSGLKTFTRLVGAFIEFMNSGQGKGALSWIGGGLSKVGGKIGGGIKNLLGRRASGGPVLGHGAYVVGEKGPEIFVPKTSGSIIPNHKAFRAEGGDVTPAPTIANPISGLSFDMSSLIGPLVGGSLGALAGGWVTGGPIGAAIGGVGGALVGGNMEALPGLMGTAVGGMTSSPIFQGIVGAMNVLTGTISSIFAPLAPIMGMMGTIGGLASGLRKGLGGGADMTPVIKSIQATSFAEQSAINKGHRGSNNILSLIYILLQNFGNLLGAIKKLWDDYTKPPNQGGGSGTPPPVTIPTQWGSPGPLTVPAIAAAVIGTAWGLLSIDDLKIPEIPTVTVPIKWGDIPGINIQSIPTVTVPVRWGTLIPFVTSAITPVTVPVIWGTLSAFALPKLSSVTIPVVWGALSNLRLPAVPIATVPVKWGALLPLTIPALAPTIIPVIWGKLTGVPSTGVDVIVSPRIDAQSFTGVLSTLISQAFSNAWSSWKDRLQMEEGDTAEEDRSWAERIRNMTDGLDGSFRTFINDLKTTLAGGVPIDVKIDVDSVTQTVKTITETIVSGAAGGVSQPTGVPTPTPATTPTYVPPGASAGTLGPNGVTLTSGTPVTNPTPAMPPPVVPSGGFDAGTTIAGLVGGAVLPVIAPAITTIGSGVIAAGDAIATTGAGIISGLGLPGFAAGGRPSLNVPSLVGEKGPELFVPDSSPTSVSGGGGGGGANVTNHFTFNVTTNNPKELTDAVMRELKLELARVKM